MTSIRLQLTSQWRIWPWRTRCTCDNSDGWIITVIPFTELSILKEKVPE